MISLKQKHDRLIYEHFLILLQLKCIILFCIIMCLYTLHCLWKHHISVCSKHSCAAAPQTAGSLQKFFDVATTLIQVRFGCTSSLIPQPYHKHCGFVIAKLTTRLIYNTILYLPFFLILSEFIPTLYVYSKCTLLLSCN